jgi:colanic acid biosynthesis glycosyl transferase WcaI
MRILVISQYFWPENFRINDLVAELVQRSHEVTVLTGRPNYPGGKFFEVFERHPEKFSKYLGAHICRVPILPRGSGGWSLLLNYFSFVVSACLFGFWRLRNDNYDIIFVYEPSPVTVGLPAVFLGKLKRVPIVFWVQDLWPNTLSAIGAVKSPMLLILIGYLVKFIYKHCNLILGQSPGFLKNIAEFCPDLNKIKYFPNWAEDLYSHSSDPPAPEISIKEDSFNILFAGNIGEAQDFPAILNAADILRDEPTIRWLILGDGRMLDWLKAEVIRLRLEHRFILLGHFPLERMPAFYAHADALLVSLREDPIFSLTIPGKIQSYLSYGIPILGMLDGDGSDVILKSNAGLVCPAGDYRALASNIRKILFLSKDQRNEFGKNGRNYSSRVFNKTSLMDQLEAWFIGLAHCRN